MTSTLTPSGITRAVRAAGGNPDVAVRAEKTAGGYTVTMPDRWTAAYLSVHPGEVNLGRAAELLSGALGFPVWVTEVRPGRSSVNGPVVRFDVSLAK